MITRRKFIASAGAFVSLRAQCAEKPLWKAGIVTDTHVLRTRASCELVRMACDLFAENDIDIFVNCGDIADHYYPEAYPILNEITNAAFPTKPPRKIWVYANHDRIDRKDEPWEKVMADVKRLLSATNDFYDLVDMQGYPLLVFPQCLDFARADKMIADVCADAKYAGKPVFVFDHVPPEDTTDNSVTWGNRRRRDLYSKYPRIVNISGHVHGSLRSELNIWQGEFTSVNMGCLQNWDGHAVGGAPTTKKNYGAVVMEVYCDRIVFRRFDVRTKEEYGADELWTVPLPFNPETAPYRRDRTAAVEPVPQFPEGAVLSLKALSPFAAVEMSFPRANGKHGTYIYKVQVTTPDGEALARNDMFGQFYLPERERASVIVRSLSAGYFDPGRKYRVRITPCNCFGVGGRPIEADFTAPEATCFATLFESSDPMGDCPFMTQLEGGERVKAVDGWYSIDRGFFFRLELPNGIWKERGRYRFTVDMETSQPGPRTWTLVLRYPGPPLENANARIATPRGESGKTRYVIEFSEKHLGRNYYLLVSEGGKGKIRFSKVKLEFSR